MKEGEGNVAAGSNSPIIKVKTLEEILREKALKKMEERRAERKADKESDQSGEAAVSESTGQRSAPTNGMRVEDDAEEDSSVRRAGSDGGEPNEGMTLNERTNSRTIRAYEWSKGWNYWTKEETDEWVKEKDRSND